MSSVPLTITHVHHDPNAEALKGCYFVIGPSVIEFYDKDATVVGALDGDVRLNANFTFVLKDDPGVIWQLTVTSITSTEIKGTIDRPSSQKDSDYSSGSGTFQAQAGGTGVPLPHDPPVAKGKATV